MLTYFFKKILHTIMQVVFVYLIDKTLLVTIISDFKKFFNLIIWLVNSVMKTELLTATYLAKFL